MTLHFKVIRLFFFVVFTQATAYAWGSPLPKSIILSTHDLSPYGSYQEDGSFKGVAVDVVACALDKINVELKLHVRPWQRAQFEVQKGIAHGFFAASQNDKRDSYARKSIIIAEQKWQWYLLEDSDWDTKDDEFKANAKVASFLGANMQAWLQENGYYSPSVPNSTDQLPDMLLTGRLDAALANNFVMQDIINKRELNGKFKSVVLKNKPLYVYFQAQFVFKYPNFLEAFNSAIPDCRKAQSLRN